MQTSLESKSLFSADKRLTFLLLCLATFFLLYVKKAFIENETAAFEFLEDTPAGSMLQLISALQFLTIPLIYLWKFTVIGFVIWVGSFMFGYRITYSQCWGVAVVSEFTFLIPELLKIFWFLFFAGDPTYYEVMAYYPLSLMHFFDYFQIDKRYVYPLKALNLFEVVYWFVLATGIHFFARKEKRVARLIILCSYTLIFFLWLLFYVMIYR
jgi:hypothetical protein